MHPLSGHQFTLREAGLADDYCAALLKSLGATVHSPANGGSTVDAAVDWANSGLMPLTGHSSGPPLQGPGSIASCACGALQALRLLAINAIPADLHGATLLSERAAILQLQRQGAVSPNGSCHLLAARNGWLALNLAREDDWQLLPAWLESGGRIESWESIASQIGRLPVQRLVERGRLMGLPVAAARPPSANPPPWVTEFCRGNPALNGKKQCRPAPLVVDLSALWAGPLCAHLLMLAGARVIKVESSARPDGARLGSSLFFDLLNGGKSSVALDLSAGTGRRQLRELLMRADIVVESSRPRALQQLGIDAEELVHSVPGITWVSITGYGRREPEANWVAFGDDAAVAAGIASATADPPLFCGDALADPLTGLHAALAAMACWRGGRGALLDLSLYDVTAHCLGFNPDVPRGTVMGSHGAWQLSVDDHILAVQSPRPRQPVCAAASLGYDTGKILQELQITC